MKASEIRTDGTEYAYQSTIHSSGQRVRVVEKTTVPATWHGNQQSGWTVEFLDPTRPNGVDKPAGHRRAVTSRQIVGPWEVFDRRAREEREERIRLHAAVKAEDARQEAAVDRLEEMFPGRRFSTQRIYTATELLALIEGVRP